MDDVSPLACVAFRAECATVLCPNCGVAQRAGRFVVERVISQSQAGRVYLARDAVGARVALKELVFQLVPAAANLEAFERETAFMCTLKHPRIPAFVDAFREGEGPDLRLYLAVQWIEGESLGPQLARGPLDGRKAAACAREVLWILRVPRHRGEQAAASRIL